MGELFSRTRRFLDELKRRKVFRVAAVYAGTAFVVLQAANLVFPTLNVPPWTFDVLVVLTLFGFPIAVVLAWAFEVTPQGIQRSPVPGSPPLDSEEEGAVDPSLRTDSRASPAEPAWLGARTVVLVGMMVLLGFGLGAGWFAFLIPEAPAERSEPSRALRVSLLPPPGMEFDGGLDLALSPYGRRLVFDVEESGDPLRVRDLGELEARPVPGTEGGSGLFWSPDGEEVAFEIGGRLRVADLRRGGVRTLVEGIAANEGGDWNDDGVIIFVGEDDRIYRVSEDGGEAVAVTDVVRGGSGPTRPNFLTDGHQFLYSLDNAVGVFVGDLDGSEPREILPGAGSAYFAPPGWLLYNTAAELETLFARRFDPEELEFLGPPIPLATRIQAPGSDLSYSVSEEGHLVYLADPLDDRGEALLLLDRERTALDTIAFPDSAWNIRWSPTGDRIAFSGWGLWVRDLDRPVARRLPDTSPFVKLNPTWAPDDSLVAYWTRPSAESAVSQLWAIRPDGTGPRKLLESDSVHFQPAAWSPEGRYLVGRVRAGDGGGGAASLRSLDLAGGGLVRLEHAGSYVGSDADFSPDGGLIAFEAIEGGQGNVFVVPFPGPGPRTRVSPSGGADPRWRADGRQLFYRDPDAGLVAVEVTRSGESPAFSAPRQVFPEQSAAGRSGRIRFPGPDGRRFLTPRQPSSGAELALSVRPPLTLVVGWAEELEGGGD